MEIELKYPKGTIVRFQSTNIIGHTIYGEGEVRSYHDGAVVVRLHNGIPELVKDMGDHLIIHESVITSYSLYDSLLNRKIETEL